MAAIMSNYKYDIAISLCKEDLSFARKLVAALNSNLKVFFYEDRQDELISKSGPEAFTRVFKEECRVVVILSRKEWSDTFYTELEKNAIVDRLSSGKEGFGFLFVIPLAPKQVPTWYPETRIYADPTRFSIEELARFIEFKVTEQGGEVKQLSFKDRTEMLIKKINGKKELIQSQRTQEAIIAVQNELKFIKENLQSRFETEVKTAGFNNVGFKPYHNFENHLFLEINKIQMNVEISDAWDTPIKKSSQDYSLLFTIYDLRTQAQIAKSPLYRFFFNKKDSGWAEVVNYENSYVNQFNQELLFKNSNTQTFYDLKGRIPSKSLINYWLNHLLDKVSGELEKYIN
ncbi:hypothetical protein MASR2M44_12150 [Bacteroidota bacterium]